ncbi:MAG: EpsG family protein [Ginsengibacter sp.]
MLIYFIYFLLLAIIAVEFELRPFKNNLVAVLIIIALALLAGLRAPEVARDYLPYQYAFDNYKDLMASQPNIFFNDYEPGFFAIVIIFRTFFEYNYGVAIMLFFAFASVFLNVYVYKRIAINPYLAILVYYSHYFILHEMTQIRIGLATGIALIALLFYIKRKDPLLFILFIIIATFFHYSAISFLALLFFRKNSFNYLLFSSLLVLSFILAYVKVPLVNFFTDLFSSGITNQKLSGYSGIIEYQLLEDVKVFNVINIMKVICSVYLMIRVRKEVLKNDATLNVLLKCNILSVFVLSFFSGVPLVAFRISELFGFASVFIFAYMAKYLPFKKFNIWFVILIAMILLYINIIHGDLLQPYHIINFIT